MTALKNRDAVLPCTPSLVIPREPNHQRPCHACEHEAKGGCDATTYDNDRKSAHEHETVERKDPDRVFALDDPLRNGNANAELLLAVGVAVLLQILTDSLIGQPGGM